MMSIFKKENMILIKRKGRGVLTAQQTNKQTRLAFGVYTQTFRQPKPTQQKPEFLLSLSMANSIPKPPNTVIIS